MTVAFKEGGQYFMRVVALVLREVLAEYPDGFPRRKEPPDRSIPLIAAGRTEDGERYIETEHPAFSEHGTIRAALLLAELKLAEEGEKLFRLHPEVFDPSKISSMSSGTLTGLLKAGGVTRFPGQDVKAWRTIAKNLHSGDDSPIRRLIDSGVGDAVELLEDLRSKDKKGNTRFPQLRGRKIGPMWISIMADPCQGGARIDRIDAVPVAVDVHVKRVTEYFGLASTQKLSTTKATPIIQKVWRDAVENADIGGPPGIKGMCAALDQALWSFGREGRNLWELFR